MKDVSGEIPAIKDESRELPVPTRWRPVFASIVSAFAEHDYLLNGIPDVVPLSDDTVTQVREYVQDYGEQLIALPEQTWESSVCLWTGSHWEVIIDLWTQAEGRSDLVLGATVRESDPGYSFAVNLVYVP